VIIFYLLLNTGTGKNLLVYIIICHLGLDNPLYNLLQLTVDN